MRASGVSSGAMATVFRAERLRPEQRASGLDFSYRSSVEPAQHAANGRSVSATSFRSVRPMLFGAICLAHLFVPGATGFEPLDERVICRKPITAHPAPSACGLQFLDV